MNNKSDIRCPECKATTENTYALKCCKCAKWNHIKCVNVNKAKLNFYEKEMRNPNGQRWCCKPCETKSNEIVKRPSMGEIKSPTASSSANSDLKKSYTEYTLNDVMEKLEVIDVKYTNLLQKYNEQIAINENLLLEVEHLKGKVTKLECKVHEEQSSSSAIETIQELKDREYKRKNLIIFGVKELSSDEPDERKTHDMRAISQMLESQCTEVSRENLRVYRIGRREQGKVRPVRIIMACEADVQKVIKKALNIKSNHLYSGLGFSIDKTKQQLQEYKRIKDDLKKRVDEGGENLMIKYVRGQPKIVQAKN